MRRQGENAGQKNREAANNSFREAVSEEWLPLALSIGLTEGEFGRLTPAGLAPYVKAHQIRQKSRLEEINFQCWMTGIYFTHALGCAFSQNASYPDAPFELFAETVSPEEKSRRDAELFAAYVSEYNLQMKKEEK